MNCAAVVDFDPALRDPAHPARMLPISDCGDHLPPSDQGYNAMGNAIDLALFDSRRAAGQVPLGGPECGGMVSRRPARRGPSQDLPPSTSN